MWRYPADRHDKTSSDVGTAGYEVGTTLTEPLCVRHTAFDRSSIYFGPWRNGLRNGDEERSGEVSMPGWGMPRARIVLLCTSGTMQTRHQGPRVVGI